MEKELKLKEIKKKTSKIIQKMKEMKEEQNKL